MQMKFFGTQEKLNKTFEYLEDDVKKGQQKFKAPIISCIYPWRLWWKQVLKETCFDGHVNSQYSKKTLNSFVFF